MNRKLLLTFSLCLPAAALVFTGQTGSQKSGVLPGDVIQSYNVGSLVLNANQSCGAAGCHAGTSAAPPQGVTVTVAPAARSLPANSSTSIQVSGSSSVSTTAGGFAATVSAGTLIGDTTTVRTSTNGLAATHRNNFSRSWKMGFKCPSTPQKIDFYTVVNTVNGNGKQDSGDVYGFHGSNPKNTVSTPVRLMCNDASIKSLGDSCADSYGNHSVLGATSAPQINTTFNIEAYGLPPSALCALMIGIGNPIAFDLKPAGAPGCILRVIAALEPRFQTSSGNASRAEGALKLPLKLPNDSTLKNLPLILQVLAVDSNSSNSFPVVATNAIQATTF